MRVLSAFEKVRRTWFGNTAVQFEIIKYTSHRELSFLGGGLTVRWLRAAYTGMLQQIMTFWKVWDRNVSMYSSLSTYSFIPKFSFNHKKRLEESREWLNNNKRHDAVEGIDFGIDIDYKDTDYRSAFDDTIRICELYNKHEVNCAVWCSGGHGFHIVIPYQEINKVFDYKPSESEILDFHKLLARALMKKLKLKNIDLSVYNPSRLFKLPYSLTKDNFPIFPLTLEELKEFKEGKRFDSPEWIIKNITIRNRGVFLNGKKGKFNELLRDLDE